MTKRIDRDIFPVPLAGQIDLTIAEAAPFAGFQLEGCRPPLFIMRSWSEELPHYRSLVPHLDAQQPVITVAPPAGTRKDDFPCTVEAWSDFCLERLSALELPDPILLGGWSFGGVLALEVGRKLERAGRRVALLAMLDTRIPTKHRNEKKEPARSFSHSLVHHLDKALETEPGKRRAYVQERLAWQTFHLRRRIVLRWHARAGRDAPVMIGPDGRPAGQRDVSGMTLLQKALWTAYLKYEPRESTIPLALHWCAESCDRAGDVSLGWSTYQRGPLVCEPLSGRHLTMFEEPHAHSVGQALQRSLDGVCSVRDSSSAGTGKLARSASFKR